MKLLTGAPGVGLITGATYLAVLGTRERFAGAEQVARYIARAPSTYDSGQRRRHGAITKQGGSPLRSVLCEVEFDPHVRKKALYHRIKKRQGAAAREGRRPKAQSVDGALHRRGPRDKLEVELDSTHEPKRFVTLYEPASLRIEDMRR